MTNSGLLQLELFTPTQLLSNEFKFTFVDLFAGIGGFRIPLEELGGKCLAYSEIDTEAIKIYRQNFINYSNQNELELGDVTKINTLPSDINIVVSGVPCQPWSVAGKLKEFDDPRGKLWFDVLKLLDNSKPLAFDDLQELIPDLKISELNELISKNIFRETANNKYEFVNSKNMSGINGIYRIFLPSSQIISTLTATGARDFITTCQNTRGLGQLNFLSLRKTGRG